MQIQAAGLPWFAADDYESFRATLPDRLWHATYSDWLRAAEQTQERLRKRGIVAVKAHVRSHEFVGWCRATGRNVDTAALTAFANEVALRAHLGAKGH